MLQDENLGTCMPLPTTLTLSNFELASTAFGLLIPDMPDMPFLEIHKYSALKT